MNMVMVSELCLPAFLVLKICVMVARSARRSKAMLGFALLIGVVAWNHDLVQGFSHTRPHNVPFNMRERMLKRPKECFKGRTGRSERDQDLYFANWPLGLSGRSLSGRNPKFGHWRKVLKDSRTSKMLLKRLDTAISKGEVDASVISSAMQKCGYNCWWETLMEVDKRQKHCKIRQDSLQARIFLTAMASCLKRSTLPDALLATRRQKALSLGKSVWAAMPPPMSEFDFNPAISSAWNLCTAVGPESLSWAKEIAEWADTVPHGKDILSYTNLLSILEQCGQYGEVDSHLREMSHSRSVSANEVLLGNLINEAAAVHNWKRADDIWKLLVHKLNVEPNRICYTAYAKVHLLSGQARRQPYRFWTPWLMQAWERLEGHESRSCTCKH